MTKYAKELRHLFVDVQGQEEIVVQGGTGQSVMDSFKAEIQNRVKTEWLEGWITPGFSTSTPNDNMTATVLMLGQMKQYSKFTNSITCGLPSVQLLGQREDWAKLFAKLEMLRQFGEEPVQYAKNLRPILETDCAC